MDFTWGKLVGTNGEPVFSRLSSIVYPWCFTPDSMHLVDENTPRLYLTHWMGGFADREAAALKTAENPDDQEPEGTERSERRGNKRKKTKSGAQGRRTGKGRKGQQDIVDADGPLPESQSQLILGPDSHVLSKAICAIIGVEISSSHPMIPTDFGKKFRDISKYLTSYKASELLNFMHLVSPVVLNRRLPEEEYNHWHHLVLSLQILEQERLKYLPYIAHVPEGLMVNDEDPRAKLFKLSKGGSYSSSLYPDYLLMRPKQSRVLSKQERRNLKAFTSNTIHDPKETHLIWGRAVAGRGFSNQNAYEVIGSKMSNVGSQGEPIALNKRDDSYVRYITKNKDGDDVSFFGRALFFLVYKQPDDNDESSAVEEHAKSDSTSEPFLLAYMQRVDVGRVRKRKLVFKIRDGSKEFINLDDIQELVGRINSRGKEFFVSKTSCFWPKKGFEWKEAISNDDPFGEDEED